jgi:uncharacterized RDD family membrane protein YckC
MDEMQTETNTNNPSDSHVAPGAEMTGAMDDGKPVLASLEKRLGAALIDGLISAALLIGPMVLFFGSWTRYIVAAQTLGISFLIGTVIFSSVVYVLVNGYLLAKNGQTVGKKLLNIKIVRTNGAAVDLKRVVLYRFLPARLVTLVPIIGNFLVLIEVLFIFRASRQCIHDQIADTIVVNA